MELARLFLAIAAVVFIGWNILSVISAKRKWLYLPESLAISYGLGFAFISMEMLLFYFFKWEFNLACIMAPWLVLFLANMVLYRKKHHENPPDKLNEEKGGKFLGLFLVSGITFEVLYAFFRALIKPIESYDAISIYAIKSKILYLAGSIPQDFFTKILHLFPHPDYPLNIPLSEVFVYIFLGRLNDQLVKVIFPLYFVALLIVVYFSIRRFSNRNYALLFTFLLASLPQVSSFAANGYLEVTLSYYCFTSAIFLLRWFEEKEALQYLVVSGLFAALAGWTKNEGLLYCVTNTLLIVSFILSGAIKPAPFRTRICCAPLSITYPRNTPAFKPVMLRGFMIFNRARLKWREGVYLILYLGIIFSILFPWAWIKRSAHIVNSEIVLAGINPANLVKQLYKIGPIIYEFQKQFFGPKKWNILWPAALFVISVNYRKAFEGAGKYIALALFLTISGYILFYLISYVDINFFLAKTWSRFLIHFLPLVIYWMAQTLKDDIKI